jgi:hypothetical protein
LTNSKFIRSLQFNDSLLIDDSHLVRVLPHLQMILELDVSGCRSLSDSTLIKLAQQCPSLQILDISRLSITGRCIEQIFRYCTGLEILRANACADFQREAFDVVHPDSLRSLKELSLVRTPANLDRTLPSCARLRALLASSSLHDSLLIPFLQSANALEVLHMGAGARVTVSSLLAAVQQCGVRLRSLTFHPPEDFAVMSDEALRVVCLGCPQLRSLSLANCREVSTFWVGQLLDRLPLESLALFGWERANAATLRVLAPHAGRLRMFCVGGCRRVAARAVVEFVGACPAMRVLKLAETGANDADGRVDPGVCAALANAREGPPGTLVFE